MFDTEHFIVEIEKRPAIYDVNCDEYNDRNAKMNAWDEVCQVMIPNWEHLTDEERNVEEKNLRGKWRNIRDYFMKELKLQKSCKSGPASRKRKKYMYFDRLLFLMPTVENRRNAGGCIKKFKSEESEGEMDNPVIEEYDMPVTHAGTSGEYLQAIDNYQKAHRQPKSVFSTFDNELHDMLSSHSSQRMLDEEDYDKMFLLSLLPILRQIPDEKKLDVRIQMQQVLAASLYPSDKKVCTMT